MPSITEKRNVVPSLCGIALLMSLLRTMVNKRVLHANTDIGKWECTFYNERTP